VSVCLQSLIAYLVCTPLLQKVSVIRNSVVIYSHMPSGFQFFLEHPELSIIVNITSDTPIPIVVHYLAKHSSITDLTDELSHSHAITPHAVATGGLSDVYCATRSDGTQLAIKCLRKHDPKHVKRTARELNTWSKLKHQNILELAGLAVFQGHLAMVSPWMEYGSVSSMVKNWQGVDRYNLCWQLALAVEYVHRENVVHGDIKGDNLLVDRKGVVKLTDFGLAIMQDEVLQFSQTDPGGGTARWMAPELYGENPQRSRETDMYATGMTMLEILTGKVPFCEFASGHSVIGAVIQGRTPSVKDLQTEPVEPRLTLMMGILQWCWKYEPSERATARRIARLMNDIVDSI